MIIVRFTVWDYDFLPEGDYGWVKISETIYNTEMNEFITELMNEYDSECRGNIWSCAEYDNNGNLTGFIFQENSTQGREYVYEIL